MPRTYAENNIRQLRKERGFSMEELAHAISEDTSLTTISKLETGKRALSLDWIIDIARALGVSRHDIIADDQSLRMMPVIGQIAAGNWSEALETPEGFIPVPAVRAGVNRFALRVMGDSMNMIVPEGGTVIVDPAQIELHSGKLYAVRNGAGDTTFKRFRTDPPRLEPDSSNPAHKPIIVGAEPFTVIGRIIYAGTDL